MFLAKKWIFSQFLSATIGPSVALVSAPRTTPSLKMMPTIVVPVFIDFGSLKPFLINISLLNNKQIKIFSMQIEVTFSLK